MSRAIDKRRGPAPDAPAGRPMDLVLVCRLGAEYLEHKAKAEAALAELVDELEAAGDRRNLKAVENLTRIPRSTFYGRLRRRRIDNAPAKQDNGRKARKDPSA